MVLVIVDDGNVTYSNLLGKETASRVQEMLREANCFIPAFSGGDPYSIETYILEYLNNHQQAVFLIDRNIYSDVLELARGEHATEGSRISAAVMAFARASSSVVEPVLAMHEGTSSRKSLAWKRDLALLHAADNVHPQQWTDIALGKSDRFEKSVVRRKKFQPPNPFDPKLQLRNFHFNYPVVLKLANLVRRGGNRNERMKEFIDWMYWKWHFSAPSFCLAITVLGESPAAGAFKNLKSEDRDKALRGVRNAAWDMAYVQEWFVQVKKQGEEDPLLVLCSRDALMLKVAGLLHRAWFGDSNGEADFRAQGFSRSTVELHRLRSSTLDSSDRALMPWPDTFDAYKDQLVSDLETEFRSN